MSLYGLGKTYTVSRRYNEFVLLHSILVERYKTLLIPDMPQGTGVGIFKSRKEGEVIEERRLKFE